MRSALLLATLGSVAGCGRVAFDPLVNRDASGDATAGGPDARLDGGSEPPGLLLHFAFEADGLMHDRSLGQHDAICLPTCPVMTTGRIGLGAASFAGGSCLTVPDALELRPPRFTFALWLQPSMSAQPQSAFGRPFNGTTAGTNTIEMFVGSPDTWKVAVNTMSVPLALDHGVWHHIAGAFDGNTLTMYVDGTPRGAPLTTGAAVYANDDFFIGCDLNSGTPSNGLTGLVDDVRFYDHTLSAAELAALAAM